MQIKKVVPSGYCKGVVNAINLAIKARKDNPDKDIYVLGMIVHNRYLVKALEKINIQTLHGHDREALIKSIDKGIIIFSAHGIADKYKKLALDCGLEYIDASCSDVISTQNKIKEHLAKNEQIVYIGKKNHPEADAVLAISDDIIFITKLEDIETIKSERQIYVTNQTTMSLFEMIKFFEKIKALFPKAIIEQEICNATTVRQNAIIKLDNCDLLFVVGDPASNNTNKLKEIAKEKGINNVIAIETVKDIKEADLFGVNNIFVTAGASTPGYLVNQVIQTLKNYDLTGQLIKPDIEVEKII